MDLGLELLRHFVRRACRMPGGEALHAWRQWLGRGESPDVPPALSAAPTPVSAARWQEALPELMRAAERLTEDTLGTEKTDRLMLEAYEALTREYRGDAGLSVAVHLLPERLLHAGESALLAQIRELEQARAAEADARVVLKAVLDAATTGILVTDEHGMVAHANEEAGHLFGRAPADLVGTEVLALVPPRHRDAHRLGMLRAAAAEMNSGSRPVSRRLDGLRADGSEFPLELTLRTLVLPNGRRLYTAGLRDLTETLTLQARMALTDRLVSVGTLAAGAAHEINNPLAYVTMNAEYVRDVLRDSAKGEPLPPYEELIEALDQALDGARRIQRIVKALRTLARSAPACEGGVEVHRPLETALRLTDNELRHRARVVERLGTPGPVHGDEARLCQVFSNLLLNAAQSIPTGAVSEHLVEIETAPGPEGGATITIRDTGHGIAPENAARVFDPFFTTRPPGQGLGLGLTISHAIVTQLGGQLSLAPHPERGTIVTLHLRGAEPTPRTLTPAPDGLDADPINLLIVDDEPLLNTALVRSLIEHHVVAETSARHALARLSAGEPFDVILCDVMMPEMNAATFWEQLGIVRPELQSRVVFMTGGAFAGELRNFLQQVGNPCLEKPLDIQELRRTLRRVPR